MRIRNVRLALFVFPVVVILLLVFALVVQQAFSEKQVPESQKPMPRVFPPQTFVSPVYNATESQASIAVEETQRLIDYLNKSDVPFGGFDIDFAAMKKSYYGENVSALLKRADLLNQTPEQKELADQIYALVYAAVRSGQKLGTNYSFVVHESYVLKARAQTAFAARDALRLLDLTMSEQDSSLNLSKVEFINEQALQLYSQERFSDVFEKVNEGFAALEEARVDLSRTRALIKASRRTIWYFAVDNWAWLIFAVALFGFSGFVASNEIRLYLARSKLSWASNDIRVIKEMMKSCQQEYYGQNLGQTRYKNRMSALNERLQKIHLDAPALRRKIRRYSVWSVSKFFKK